MNKQSVTISFFKYQGVGAKWWAMKQMQEAQDSLRQINGLQFCKLLGSGAGDGFSILPDLSTYAFLGVWQTDHHAKQAIQDAPVLQEMKAKAKFHFTIFMQPVASKGSWDGQNPFIVADNKNFTGPVAVLTRASIARNKLLTFWKNVPQVSRRLKAFEEGIYFSKGIGEFPLLQQATFSLWENREAMVNYAYKSKKHREMIRKTRELGWYKEEMFAEFKPYFLENQWPGMDMKNLDALLSSTHEKEAGQVQ